MVDSGVSLPRLGSAAPSRRRRRSTGGPYPSSRSRTATSARTWPAWRKGARYKLRLDGGELYPDPASRYQPEGPHGPSQIVDPSRYRWTDGAWKGVSIEGQVLYEMHVGTFTREGTWRSATAALERLRGVCSVIEMMPIADFAGDFGWGYDGVDFFAPTRAYGTPDDLRAFVDRAHALGFGVMLDVVYNHAGPDGNYLAEFSHSYFTDRHKTAWGQAINYDGPGSRGVREFFLANAGYWIDEYRFDGLRLDATDAIYDDSTPAPLGGDRPARPRVGPRPQHDRRRRERAAGHPARPATRGRRVRARWRLERRHPSRGVRGADRQGRGVLQRLPRRAPGARVRREARIPVSGSGLLVAEGAARLVDARRRALALRQLSGDPRPGRQHGRRQETRLVRSPRSPARADRLSPARSRHPDALSGPGVRVPPLRSCSSRITGRRWLRRWPRGGRSSSTSFRRPGRPGARGPTTPPIPRTLARCKLDETRGDEEWLALHRDLFELRRTDPTVRRAGPLRDRRRRAERGRLRPAIGPASARTPTGCSSSTWERTAPSFRRPSPSSRRRTADPGRRCGPRSLRGTAGTASCRPTPATDGGFAANRPPFWPPSTDDDE